jgi:hypothetical protein
MPEHTPGWDLAPLTEPLTGSQPERYRGRHAAAPTLGRGLGLFGWLRQRRLPPATESRADEPTSSRPGDELADTTE